MKWKLTRLYWKIRSWFIPQQKWLTQKIPRTWTDKCDLIPTVLSACVIHFVEKEEGLHDENYDFSEELSKGYVSQWYVGEHTKFCKDIRRAYELWKIEIPLLKEMERIEMDKDDPDFERSITYEKEWKKREKEAAALTVLHMHRLWT